MSWQPDIGSEVTRRAIENASGRSQLRSTPGASNVQEAIFKTQVQKSKGKPAAPKPVSSGTREALTQGAIAASKDKRAKEGAAITRRAIGATVPTAAGTGYGDMLMDRYSGLRNPSAGNTYDVPTGFNKEEFKNDIIRQSIADNMLTGGRHPDAAPLKGKGNGEGEETPPKRTPLDRSNGTQTSPSGNGINQSGLNEFADLLGSKYNIRLQNGFQSNDLPGVSGVGPVADGATYARGVEATRGTTGIGPYADGDVYGQSIAPTNPQAGSSPIPDQAEIKSSVPVGVDDRFADGAEYGDTPTSAISNRSRSFLDYDGPGGSLMALRAAEASQGYIRQGGKNYAITGAGEDGKRTFEEFSDKGRQALVKDGNSTINHSFMDQYGSKADPAAPPTADQAQSPEIGITTKVDLEPQSKIHESPADFGVGDGSFDQIMDVENNSEKLTMEPIDWMSRYRGQK